MVRGLVVLALAMTPFAALAGAQGRGLVHARHVIGHSVRGRPIVAVESGNPRSPRRIVVVGCIHGDEPAGIAIARILESARPSNAFDLWIVEDLNPDGVALGTHQNADGVDLNRNFPWQWEREGRGRLTDSGPSALSEPESRAMRAFLLRLRPHLVVWYHQPFGVVDESGGSPAVERRYAQLVGMSLRRLPRYSGSATSWTNAAFPGATSFVVELPPGPLPQAAARRHASTVLALAAGS